MNVDFITAIKLYFANYFNFSGRSTRAEYWWATLFILIVSMILSLFGLDFLNGLFSLAIIIPSIAICFRRFHDTGKSGWWVIGLGIVSVIGAGIMYGPMFTTIMANADNPAALESAMTSYIQNNISSIGIGGIISLAASIWSLIILVKPSAPDNKYGPNPYGGENA